MKNSIFGQSIFINLGYFKGYLFITKNYCNPPRTSCTTVGLEIPSENYLNNFYIVSDASVKHKTHDLLTKTIIY